MGDVTAKTKTSAALEKYRQRITAEADRMAASIIERVPHISGMGSGGGALYEVLLEIAEDRIEVHDVIENLRGRIEYLEEEASRG